MTDTPDNSDNKVSNSTSSQREFQEEWKKIIFFLESTFSIGTYMYCSVCTKANWNETQKYWNKKLNMQISGIFRLRIDTIRSRNVSNKMTTSLSNLFQKANNEIKFLLKITLKRIYLAGNLLSSATL